MPRNGPVTRRELAARPGLPLDAVTQVVNKVLLAASGPSPSASSTTPSRPCARSPGRDPVAVLKKAVENARPELEVRSRRVGGATYQVPVEVPAAPRHARLPSAGSSPSPAQRREKTMAERLANEILDAANGIGGSRQAQDDIHKMAESNKAFAHYRW